MFVAVTDSQEQLDIAIVGAGAAGLMASIWTGRTALEAGHTLRVAAFDGAAKLGAKILVAGGGRCNVTHHAVSEADFAGSSRHAVRKVLLRYPVDETVRFFNELGVGLKREPTGKLFPITDKARTVLDALLNEALRVGVGFVNPCRVEAIEAHPEFFLLRTMRGDRRARRVILATGGKALPRTGSDGAGFEFAKSLGHTLTSHTFPALAPLLLPSEHPLLALSGVAQPATLSVTEPSGKRLTSFTNDLLITHFGLSGPVVLDISRFWSARVLEGLPTEMRINWIPQFVPAAVEHMLLEPGPTGVARILANHIPERLARALCEASLIDPARPLHSLRRDERKALLLTVTDMRVPIVGDRGFTFAEATAGGVPLSEVVLETMASRPCPGLHLCGEILDVDGRVGGFNFQWAWASGFVAGVAAANGVLATRNG